MNSRKILLVYFVSIIQCCFSYKFLIVFPLPGRSHSLLGEGFVRHLLGAGHEITYITPFPIKDPPKQLRQIDVTSNFDLYPRDQLMDIKKLMSRDVDMTDISVILELLYNITQGTVMHKSVQHMIHDLEEEYDAVIAQWLFSDILSGLAAVFDCPFIWFSSLEPHSSVMSLISEDLNPSYIPDLITSSAVPPLSFRERVKELWNLIKLKYAKWRISDIETKTYNEAFASAVSKRGRILPPIEATVYNSSLMFGNSHVAFGRAVAFPQNYIPIAGFHIHEEIKPLPENLQRILDSTSNGVIYFSMGSLLKSESMPDYLKRDILDMFSGLNQTVIWKLEENVENLPKNVHTVHWAPQQSILAHLNCILFISHGGLLSITEALHFKVPLIGIPMSADQFNNVNRIVGKGFAKKVDLDSRTPDNLKHAIDDILRNSSYRQTLEKLSFIYHHRPVSPGKELVYWVEHVVRTRGALHLRSPAFMVPWYQKMYLDLIVLIIIVSVFITKIVKKFMKFQTKLYKKFA